MVEEPLDNTAEVMGSGDGPVATRSDEDKVVRVFYNRTKVHVLVRDHHYIRYVPIRCFNL